MSDILINVAIVLALIVVNGVFVAAELALVTLRDGQVRAMRPDGRRSAVARLVRNPNRLLSATQIGVTLASLLSSAVGAVTLSERARAGLAKAGLSPTLAQVVGIVGVTLLISFVVLVVGELAPKRLALQRTERTARLLAPALDRFAALNRPVIWLLSKTTDGVVRLLGGNPAATREQITEEELRGLVAGHESLSRDERRLIDEVFAAGERQVREVMLPRTEVEFLEASMTVTRAARVVASSAHSRYPVVGESVDDVVGFVHIRDLLGQWNGDRARTVGDIAREVKHVPSSKAVLPALSEMRREGQHLAIVVDEYGGTAGIVTLEDLIEELVGEIRDEYDEPTTADPNLRDEVPGLLNLDEFAERTGVTLPEGPYETAAGFVMAVLGHLPAVGAEVEVGDYRLTVVEMDGRRVAALKVAVVEPSEPADAPDAAFSPNPAVINDS